MDFSRIIERWAAFRPDATAVHWQGVDTSYSVLWRRIERSTAALAGELGVVKGDRIAYLGYNDPEMLVLLFALARLGAILVPLNFRLAVPELHRVVSHAGATRLIVDREFASQATALASTNPGLRCVTIRNAPDASADWMALTSLDRPTPTLAGDDTLPLLIVYTSGTTGLPKGAVHTQDAMMWNLVCSTQCHDLVPSDHVLMSLPMFHVGGLCIQTLPALHAGARVTIQPRFDPGHWLADVAARRPDISLLVPATTRAVIEHPQFASTDLSSLRVVNMGSSVVPTSHIEAFQARGVRCIQVYGATETGPVSIYLRREHALTKVGSTGMPAVHVEVRLVDPIGRDVARGAVGEIWLRGKNLMQGYWRDPENPSFRDGWFRTGDLARIDEDGFYWIAGRSKDMIISGGENIYPAEIENVLAESSAIVECAVVGIPDEKWGEVCVACVVKKPEAALDAAGVQALLTGRIARYKLPRRVLFVDALPKTALGKVQKGELLKSIAARIKEA